MYTYVEMLVIDEMMTEKRQRRKKSKIERKSPIGLYKVSGSVFFSNCYLYAIAMFEAIFSPSVLISAKRYVF